MMMCIDVRRTTTTTTTTRRPLTSTAHARDACARLRCRHGAQCVVDASDAQSVPRCRCPATHCSTAQHRPVCASDHRDYTSECQMRAASCRLQKHIHKLYDGYCGTWAHVYLCVLSSSVVAGDSNCHAPPPKFQPVENLLLVGKLVV